MSSKLLFRKLIESSHKSFRLTQQKKMAAAAPTPAAGEAGSSKEPETMEAVLDLSPEEARTYSMILEAAATLPKTDPRFALTLTFTWWLLHRRRRLEQQRVRRRQFYRRLRRLVFLRWHLQRNTVSGAAVASGETAAATRDGLVVVPEKRLWVRNDRSEDFWTKVDNNTISPEAFRKYFHMSRETFDYVYDELAEQLQKTNTTMRDPIPGKKRLAATIYRMATNAEYIKVASLFGIGKSTTTSLVRDVCEVIVSNLKDKFLTFVGEGLNKEDMQRKVNDSASKFGIPRVIGVLGSIDVLIIGSSWDWSENSPYISSYHKNYAVIFQAVVDHDGQFCNVSAGRPSSLTNRQALDDCGLRKDFLENYSFPQEAQEGNKVPIARIIADESYSSNSDGLSSSAEEAPTINDSSWLLTPKEVEKETEDENERQLMEEKISRGRTHFDDTIMNVKSRWKMFHGKNGKINFSADAFEKIALACCILHNICILQEDEVDSSWGTDIGPEVYNRKGYPKDSSRKENDTEAKENADIEMDQNEVDEDEDVIQRIEEDLIGDQERDDMDEDPEGDVIGVPEGEDIIGGPDGGDLIGDSEGEDIIGDQEDDIIGIGDPEGEDINEDLEGEHFLDDPEGEDDIDTDEGAHGQNEDVNDSIDDDLMGEDMNEQDEHLPTDNIGINEDEDLDTVNYDPVDQYLDLTDETNPTDSDVKSSP